MEKRTEEMGNQENETKAKEMTTVHERSQGSQGEEEFKELYEESLKTFQEGEVVKGRIVSIDKEFVMIDLHPGKRHIFKKRIFYLDEDSWLILAAEEYDARGQLHRAGSMYPVQNYDYPAPWGYTYGFYDFNANAYAVDGYMGKSGILYIEKTPDASWSPEALAGMGIR